ncbi:MAG TPA: class I SAM-dependent methyltransferase [Myxococcaceae bacterium]|nr:class I SAM-dependent methyltransferase [Myxococcaceae bacterium]
MLDPLYGMRLGVDLLREARLRESVALLVKPINYWRTVEYRTVWELAAFSAADRILDIGSPKLLSVFLAERTGAEVYATDIEPYFVEKLEAIRRVRRIPEARLRLQVEDGRKLSFSDRTFDKVYSISVLEHIPDQGDTACIREAARVLRPGGRCIVTVPFAPEPRDEFKSGGFYWEGSSKRDGAQVFYQRRYSEQTLKERLLVPSGLRVARVGYIGEKVLTGSSRELSDFLPAITGPLQPLLSRLFHTPVVDSWRELAKPLCAVIALDKA